MISGSTCLVGIRGGLAANGFLLHKILSWNVRGLNEGDKRLRVRNLLRQWKADIICFRKLNWNSFLAVLCEACGDVSMWIGVIQL
jgi:hypothetical protein